MEGVRLSEIESTLPLTDFAPEHQMSVEDQGKLISDYRTLRSAAKSALSMLIHREDVEPQDCLHCLLETVLRKTEER